MHARGKRGPNCNVTTKYNVGMMFLGMSAVVARIVKHCKLYHLTQIWHNDSKNWIFVLPYFTPAPFFVKVSSRCIAMGRRERKLSVSPNLSRCSLLLPILSPHPFTYEAANARVALQMSTNLHIPPLLAIAKVVCDLSLCYLCGRILSI